MAELETPWFVLWALVNQTGRGGLPIFIGISSGLHLCL